MHRALRHRSATDEPVSESYERLEFFGDSVLGMIIAEYLYEHFPDWDQGMLSKAKATIVQEAPLAEAAERLGLHEFVRVAQADDVPGVARASILADVFEAIVGALYIEQGIAITRWFVLENLHAAIEQVGRGEIATRDYKSRLQEVAQAKWRRTPIYRLSHEKGEGHERVFHMEVLLDEEVMGSGSGRSKKEAEQAAAKEALELIERAEALKRVRADAPEQG